MVPENRTTTTKGRHRRCPDHRSTTSNGTSEKPVFEPRGRASLTDSARAQFGRAPRWMPGFHHAGPDRSSVTPKFNRRAVRPTRWSGRSAHERFPIPPQCGVGRCGPRLIERSHCLLASWARRKLRAPVELRALLKGIRDSPAGKPGGRGPISPWVSSPIVNETANAAGLAPPASLRSCPVAPGAARPPSYIRSCWCAKVD